MIDMRNFLYVKANSINMNGYDLYVIKKCSCEKQPVVIGIPSGKTFLDYMPSGSYNMIKRIDPVDVNTYSQMFFVPRIEISKRKFV